MYLIQQVETTDGKQIALHMYHFMDNMQVQLGLRVLLKWQAVVFFTSTKRRKKWDLQKK